MASFVATNVIVSAFDVGDERKREVALHFLGDNSLHLVVSAQVLNEFSWTATRRLEPPLEEEDAHDVVRHLAKGDVVPIAASLVDAQRRRTPHGSERASSPRGGGKALAEGGSLLVFYRLGRRAWP